MSSAVPYHRSHVAGDGKSMESWFGREQDMEECPVGGGKGRKIVQNSDVAIALVARLS